MWICKSVFCLWFLFFLSPLMSERFNPQRTNLLLPAGANHGVPEACSLLINHVRGSLGPLHSFASVWGVWFFCMEAKGRGGRGWKEEEESKERNLDAARIHSYLESAPGNRCQEMFILIIQEFLKLFSRVVFSREMRFDAWLVGWIFSCSILFVFCLIWFFPLILMQTSGLDSYFIFLSSTM